MRQLLESKPLSFVKKIAVIGLFSAVVFSTSLAHAQGTTGTPALLSDLQDITSGVVKHELTDDGAEQLGESIMALDLRHDAQKEAALSYGARGGLSRRNFEIMEGLSGREIMLDRVFNFRQLLIAAPSGLFIEPPIVSASEKALIITEGGVEAAVADRVYNIGQDAKIVTASRNWRTYLERPWGDVPPPPRVLWPQNEEEQLRWDDWVFQGWKAGYEQGDMEFETNLHRLTADFDGMIRYRVLVSQGILSTPFALHEDRGITGGGDEMRVGDRAIRITGPSQFRMDAGNWRPADR